MNLDRDTSSTDEYFVTALQIFDYCGADSTGTLRVDALMDKLAPFVKTNKPEYSHLRSVLDPHEDNPEINVTKLAKTLTEYRESQKSKADLDESFNLQCGQMPQDSDSGISTDGFQLLEELQCELREKAHLAQQLRSQLDFTDRQHEEALATLTAERDSLHTHLNLLREENMTLNHIRRDYEEACERLCASDLALDAARRELDCTKKTSKILQEQVSILENEKLTLQELLSKSKHECHRINDMYASRQSALLEENETLKTEHADLSARLQDHEELMQQMIKEKVLLEMELKDVLNKSNQTHMRLDRSIDVSYTEDQMLTALDGLNADSRFTQENQILDEESFMNALREDQGRATNISLFDEIRFSFCNMSRNNTTGLSTTQCEKCADSLDVSMITIGTQTDEGFNENKPYDNIDNDKLITTGTQTNTEVINDPKCLECERLSYYTAKLESDVKHSHHTVTEMQLELDRYESNLNVLQKFVDEGNARNKLLQVAVESLNVKISVLEAACANQKLKIESLNMETCCAQCQTDGDIVSIGTQVEVPCSECEKRNAIVPHRSFRKYLWGSLKCLFQVFAVVCFVFAVAVLYNASRRSEARCPRGVVPWRWLHAQDFFDLLLRMEYVADVPM